MYSILVSKYLIKRPRLKTLNSFQLVGGVLLIFRFIVVVPLLAVLLHMKDVIWFNFANKF